MSSLGNDGVVRSRKPSFCHSHENGNPVVPGPAPLLDSRLRGNDDFLESVNEAEKKIKGSGLDIRHLFKDQVGRRSFSCEK